MWNFARRLFPGAAQSEPSIEPEKSPNPSEEPVNSLENGFVFVDESQESPGKSEEEPEEHQVFIKTLRPKKKPPSDVIKGTDWESVNYSLKKIECQEDEIIGIEVSESFIAVQYYIEPSIDVYDRNSDKNECLFSLSGHEYGGGNLAIVGDHYLYSGSMDKTTICWDLRNEGKILGKAQGKT